MPRTMILTPAQRQVVRDAQNVKRQIELCEQRLEDLRARRDVILLTGAEHRVPERALCSAAGVTRGWLWQIKTQKEQL